ncbi:hypothetical protein AB0E16_22155, partial [Streptomyces sp. NPDC047970]
MDYCHPCGRHLNGALACAGCGTPAEELRRLGSAPPAAGRPAAAPARTPAHRAAPPPDRTGPPLGRGARAPGEPAAVPLRP